MHLQEIRREAADIRELMEEQPGPLLARMRRRRESAFDRLRLARLGGYANDLERRLRRERIDELEHLAGRILADRGGTGLILRHMVNVGEVALGFFAAKAVMPFVEAYVKALGGKLGETTAALLARLSLDSIVRLTQGRPVAIGADQAAAVELDPSLPDEARLALIDLDLKDPRIQGAVLRWDREAGQWRPLDPPTPLERNLRRIALVAAVLGVLPAPGAFTEGLGASLGEKTADGLHRLRLNPWRDSADAGEGSEETARLVTVEFDPDASDQALAALINLDFAAPHLRGLTLRWDETSAGWRPVVAEPPGRPGEAR